MEENDGTCAWTATTGGEGSNCRRTDSDSGGSPDWRSRSAVHATWGLAPIFVRCKQREECEGRRARAILRKLSVRPLPRANEKNNESGAQTHTPLHC